MNRTPGQDRIQGRRGAVVLVCLAIFVSIGVALIAGPIERTGRLRIAGDVYLEDLSFDLQFLDYVVLDAKARLIEEQSGVQLLGIGDSSCQFGFAPAAVEASTGMTALNLGTFGSIGAKAYLALFDHLLASGQRPASVVLWVHPHTMAYGESELDAEGQREWFLERVTSGRARSQNPLARMNDTFGGGFRLVVLDHAGWRGPQLFELLNPAMVRQRMLSNRGWFAARAQASPRQMTFGDADPDALLALTAFDERCGETGIPLFVAVMPHMVGGAEDADRYAGLVDDIRHAVPGAHWIVSMPREADWEEMQSPTHFARDLASRVSAQIAREVSSRTTTSD